MPFWTISHPLQQAVAAAPSLPLVTDEKPSNVLTKKEEAAPVVVKSQAASPPPRQKKKKKRVVRLRPKKQSKGGNNGSGQPLQVVTGSSSSPEYKGLVRGSDIAPLKPKQDDSVVVNGVSPKTKGRLRRFFSFRRGAAAATEEPSSTNRRLLSDTELLATLQTESVNGNNDRDATKRKQLPPEQEERIQKIALREEQIHDLGGGGGKNDSSSLSRSAALVDDDEEDETTVTAVVDDDNKNNNHKRRLGLVGRLFRRRRNQKRQ